jgi:hypothetical protein
VSNVPNLTPSGRDARGGLRAGGDGYFSVTGSKTVFVSVDRLFEAFAGSALPEQWLPGGELKVRTATVPKSLRGLARRRGPDRGRLRAEGRRGGAGRAHARKACRH